MLSGAAPLPRVFGQQKGIETTGRRAVLEVHLAGGDVREIPVGRRFGRAVRGPVVRMAATAHAALFAGVDHDAWREERLSAAFCDPGRVARDLGLAEPVARVRVRSWSAIAPGEPQGALEFACREGPP